LKKQQIALLALLTLAMALTIACGTSSTTPQFTKMAFLSSRTGTTSLFVANLDGSGAAAVPGSDNSYSPSISANFKKIAFIFDGDATVQNADGTGQVVLNTDGSSYFVRLSPDASHAMFSENTPSAWHLWVSKIDGSSKIELTAPTQAPLAPTTECFSGNFSPNGSQVVFICWIDGSYSMYTANADGTNVKTVMADAGQYIDTPSFTPDGKKIVFYSSGNFESPSHRNGKSAQGLPAHGSHAKGNGEVTWGITSVNLDGTGSAMLVPGSYESMILNSNLYYTAYDDNLSLYQVYKANTDGSNAVSVSDGNSDDYLGLTQD